MLFTRLEGCVFVLVHVRMSVAFALLPAFLSLLNHGEFDTDLENLCAILLARTLSRKQNEPGEVEGREHLSSTQPT